MTAKSLRSACILWLQFLFLVLNLLGMRANIVIDVNYLVDTDGLATNCYPTISPYCNLRSAWVACQSISSNCEINLMKNSSSFLDCSYGSLILYNNQNVEINGWGSVITLQASSTTINYQISNKVSGYISPKKDFFADGADLVVDQASVGSDFGTNDDFRFTNSIYSSIFYNNHPYDTYGYDNDDFHFEYQDDFNVTDDFWEYYSYQNDDTCDDPRFIKFESSDSIVPTLTVNGLELIGFGSSHHDGGAVYLSGNCSVILKSMKFISCLGYNGGAVYVNGSQNSTVVDSCTFLDNRADSGGSIYLENTQFVTMSNLTVIKSSAVYGGALYLNQGNEFILITNSTFENCNGTSGGAIYLLEYNSKVEISEIIVVNASATSYGGGIRLYESNDLINITRASFIDCKVEGKGGSICIGVYNSHIEMSEISVTGGLAISGGGISIQEYNDFIAVRNSKFVACNSNNGGGVNIGGFNTNLDFDNLLISNCIATLYGGGLLIDTYNSYFVLSNSIFENCEAYSGGAMFSYGSSYNLNIVGVIVVGCHSTYAGAGFLFFKGYSNVLISNSSFLYCHSGDSGGGLSLSYGNDNFTVFNSTFRGNNATVDGGAIDLYEGNNYFQLIDCTLTNNMAHSGGGLSLSYSNDNFTVFNSTFRGNNATDGGAICLSQGNYYFQLIDCTLTNNVALDSGGGLYSNYSSYFLSLAGSAFVGNTATYLGGAVYIHSDHDQLLVTSREGFEESLVIQSQYPYQTGSDGIIMSKSVYVPNAKGFVINFDEQSTVYESDYVYIYTNSNKTEKLFDSTGTNWPGVNEPSLTIMGSSFYVEFNGSSSYYYYYYHDDDTVTTNYYGFTMYVYPVMINPMHPSLFQNNSANVGGGIYLYYYIRFPVFINSILQGNQALDTGGGMMFLNLNIGAMLQDVTFLQNSAGKNGGGLVLKSANYGNLILDCVFESNQAVGTGGGVLLLSNNGEGVWNDNNQCVFEYSIFRNNTASEGGGLYLKLENVVQISHCTFASNIASSDGGALGTSSDNYVDMESCNVTGNSAMGSGGGFYLDSSNTLVLFVCKLASNIASSDIGGALGINELNTVNIEACDITGNFAVCGGGLASYYTNKIELTNTVMLENEATVGGAICIKSSTAMTFGGEIILKSNVARISGGGIASMGSPLWSMYTGTELVIQNNTAQRGSAMSFMELQPSDNALSNIAILDNLALNGGTVFWLKDDIMTEEPPGLNSSTILWSNNSAPFGVRASTQAIQMLGPVAYNVTVYAQSLTPAISFSLYDYYDAFMMETGVTSVKVGITLLNTKTCSGLNPYLSGQDLFGNGIELAEGLATFSQLEAYCAPEGNLTLIFTAQLGDVVGVGEAVAAPFYISNTTTLFFRACIIGEYLSNGQCLECPSGSYNLDASSQTCKSCKLITGVDDCYADELVLASGYWRRNSMTTSVLACPLPTGCIGGNMAGDALCAAGYVGPLCGVCSVGYFQEENQCIECTNSDVLTPTTIIYLCIAMLLLLIGIMSCTVNYKMISVVGSEIDDAEKKVPKDKNLNKLQLLYLWIKMQYDNIMVKVKIIVSTLQVVLAASVILTVQMPSSFTNFSNGFNFMNLNFSAIFPIGCTTNFTFIDTLILTTLAPVVVAALFAIMFFAEYTIERQKIQSNNERKKGDKKRAFNRIKDTYSNYLFYLSYLILPSVSTTIFQMFVCTNVDPGHTTSGESNFYLTADLSISCSSSYYWNGVAYACAMILVYPIGIPALYLYLLYQVRYEIMNRNKPKPKQVLGTEEQGIKNPMNGDGDVEKGSVERTSSVSRKSTLEDDDTKVLHPKVARLAFLWSAYKPQYWYWEIVDTTRRIILTAVLSVISPGSSQQNILSVLLALLYIKVYGYYQPYIESKDNVLAEIGQYSIFFTFFGALIIQNNLLGGMQAQAMGALLIIVDMCVVFISLYFMIETRRIDIRKMREDFVRMIEEAENSDKLSVLKKMSGVTGRSKKSIHRENIETLELQEEFRAQQLARFMEQRKREAASTGFNPAQVKNTTRTLDESLDSDDEEDEDRPSEVGVEMTALGGGAGGVGGAARGVGTARGSIRRSLDDYPDSDDECD